MSKKSWPIRKGIFRSACPSDFSPQRSPSPVVEMPLSPQPDSSDPSTQFRNTQPLTINTNIANISNMDAPSANSRANSQCPFSPTIREIPIEVQQEVCVIDSLFGIFPCVCVRLCACECVSVCVCGFDEVMQFIAVSMVIKSMEFRW